jgi:hypothetical protein
MMERSENMARKSAKNEHAGPKKGRGAFYGPKHVAKKGSARRRREEGKKAGKEE